MSLEKATKEKFPVTGQTKTFQLDSKAMAQYALGSSKLIASLLIIPDAFALVPNSVNFIGWALKLVGLWVSAAVLWFVSFNGILQLVKLLTDGVRINDEGIYPWRLAKLIRWKDIEAVAIEERAVFSRIFFLTPKAKRVTLFVAKGNRLVPNYLPSFLFSKESFEEIIKSITIAKFGISPSSDECIFATDSGAHKMGATNRLLAMQRILVSGLVAVSLTMFLGRKAFVNYSYNLGNKELANHQYQRAGALYQRAISIDPTFAFGWESLARSQLAMGKTAEAKQDWNRALLLKPDYVEAQLGLARLALRRGELRSARSSIDAALNLAPQNNQALLTLAMYKWQIGQYGEAQKLARTLITPPSTDEVSTHTTRLSDEDQVALCLLADLDLNDGKLDQAHHILALLDRKSESKYIQLLYADSKARSLMHDGNDAKALAVLNQGLIENPDDVPLNNLRLQIALKERNVSLADACLAKLKSNQNEDVETQLNMAKFFLLTGERDRSQKSLEMIAESKYISSSTLNEISALLNQIGAHQSAVNAAARAVLIDHDNLSINQASN